MNTSAGVMGSGADLDPKLVARINMALAQTGERERLKELLRRKLDECGWTARIRAECENEAKQMALDSLSPQEIADRVAPLARSAVPEQVQQEMLQEIRRFLDTTI